MLQDHRTFYFFAALGSLCLFANSSAVAKQKSVIPTARTSANKTDCVAVSQALYGQAETLSKRTKQIIPREFVRVAADLDEFCAGGDFRKAPGLALTG